MIDAASNYISKDVRVLGRLHLHVDMEVNRPISVTDERYCEPYMKALEANDPEQHWPRFVTLGNLPDIQFAFAASAVYSSNIEGNTIDLNAFMRSKQRDGQRAKRAKEQKEIEALEAAYAFAQAHPLTENNLLRAHAMFSESILIQAHQGRYRAGRMFVYDGSGIIYAAVEGERVQEEMARLEEEVAGLLRRRLDVRRAFYHAALLHLIFVQIHPFEDSNGRAARLLEKWFLAAHLGEQAWKIPSEEYYWKHRARYYEAINLGPTFYDLAYSRCVPFLTMLPASLALRLPSADH